MRKKFRTSSWIWIAGLAIFLSPHTASFGKNGPAGYQRTTPHEFETLVRLARKGNPQAQFNVARAYETGSGTRKSDVEAVRWYIQAANQGLPSAQFHLALIYEEGRPDIRKDLAYALSWYEEAARNGFKSALQRLEQLTSKGVMSRD